MTQLSFELSETTSDVIQTTRQAVNQREARKIRMRVYRTLALSQLLICAVLYVIFIVFV